MAYLFIAVLDVLHTISYKGMSIFTDYDYYANQLWIAARFTEASVLCGGFFFVGKDKRPVSPHALFVFFAGATSVVVLSIFFWKIFPVCFIEGQGQTPFKIIMEYVICGVLGVATVLLWRKRDMFAPMVFRYMYWSFIFTILSELAFTFYIDNYGFSNLVGHYFKIFSFYMVYKAIVETGIREPFAGVFKELVDKGVELEAAAKAAQSANQAKSAFLANMSHEIRTPLNGVLGFLQLLEVGRLDERQKEYVQAALTAGKSLLDCINDVLDFSKIEADKVDLSIEPMDPAGLIGVMETLFARPLAAKGVRLSRVVDPSVPPLVMGDSSRVKQILINLVGNAAKFTQRGAIELALERTKDDAGQDVLAFSVRDDGVGVSPDFLPHLFEPFTQEQGSLKKKLQGTGLGLAIVKRLVTAMNGEVGVASAPGRGSTFRFTLPLVPAPTSADSGAAETAPPPRTTPLPSLTILVAEDNSVNQLLIKRLLESLDQRPTVVDNGLLALKELQSTRFDLVFLDIQMPELDGLGVLQAVRNLPELYPQAQTTPFVALTAFALSEDRERFLAHGFADYLTKPIDRDMLAGTIQRFAPTASADQAG